MEIKRRQSNFAQFSKDLYITVDHDHISIDADTDDIQSQIIDAMNRI